MEITRGQILRSKAGHDQGDFQAVLSVCGAYAMMADGKRRRIEAPKKKKLIHLAPTNIRLGEESLSTNRQLRRAIASLQSAAAEKD